MDLFQPILAGLLLLLADAFALISLYRDHASILVAIVVASATLVASFLLCSDAVMVRLAKLEEPMRGRVAIASGVALIAVMVAIALVLTL